MPKLSHKYTISGSDMDPDYYLRPVAALAYCQDSFTRLLSRKYIASFDLKVKNMHWVVSEVSMEFSGELPFWSEDVLAEIWISERSKIRMYSDFTLSHKGAVFAKGSCCWLLIDEIRKRPASLDFLDGVLDFLPDFVLGPHVKFPQIVDSDVARSFEYTIGERDIDFNNHVNNRAYLNIAINSCAWTLGCEWTVEKLKARFLKECFFGDVLTCNETVDCGNVHSFKLLKNGESVCEIFTTWQKQKNKKPIRECPVSARC